MVTRRTSVLGLFSDAEGAADAVDAVKKAGFASRDYEILTGSPYPEGAFGEEPAKHRVYYFPLIGAICGLAVAILLTAGTQLSYPLVTGGKPILSLPPMVIIAYEGTMLGAILFTIIGVVFESRLPRVGMGLYDTRINEGYIGILVSCREQQVGAAVQALQGAGAEDIKQQ